MRTARTQTKRNSNRDDGWVAFFPPHPLPVRPPDLTLARRVVRASFTRLTTARHRILLPTAQAPSMGFDREARDGLLRWRMAFGSSNSWRRRAPRSWTT